MPLCPAGADRNTCLSICLLPDVTVVVRPPDDIADTGKFRRGLWRIHVRFMDLPADPVYPDFRCRYPVGCHDRRSDTVSGDRECSHIEPGAIDPTHRAV